MVFHIRCLSFFEEDDAQESPRYYTPPTSLPATPLKILRVFKFSELEVATKSFRQSAKIREGSGSGCVYAGVIKTLQDPTKTLDVAVKRLGETILKGHKEWVNEVQTLRLVGHQNLVKLVGCCAKDKERLLVYEYNMPNRSVEDHLSTSSKAPLSWITRLGVARDVACGLAYLHEGMNFQIVVQDLRSSNILLDDQWNAKLFDFASAQFVSTSVVEAIGCMAPEHIKTEHPTAKSDVWSYGAFLYELITGRLPLDTTRPENEQKLLEWVKPYIDSERFELIIDPRLEDNFSLESAQKLSIIANKCLSIHPRSRPRMSEVLEMVKQLLDGVLLQVPPRNGQVPVAYIEPNVKNEGQSGSRVLEMVNQPITVVPPQTPPRNDLVSVATIEPNMVLTLAKKTTENMKNEGETGSPEIQRKESACFSVIRCRGCHHS